MRSGCVLVCIRAINWMRPGCVCCLDVEGAKAKFMPYAELQAKMRPYLEMTNAEQTELRSKVRECFVH